MKKFNILIIFIIFFSLTSAQSAFAWGKKVKPLHTEETIKTQEGYTFPLDKQTGPFDVTEDSAMPEEKIQEAAIERVDVVDQDDSFSKGMKLSSETVDFYAETGQYVAKGDALLVIPEEKLQLSANEIIIDHRNFEVTGIGNVRVLKNNTEYYGDYIRVNSKKESSFFENPILYYGDITIDAKTATMYTGDIYANNGSSVVDTKGKAQIISTTGVGSLQVNRLFDQEKVFDSNDNNIKIVAKKIHVKRKNGYNDVTIKNATVYKGKYKVGYLPTFRLTSDKSVNYVETIFPEIGSHGKIGTYIAPSLVFALPNAATLKAGPLVSKKNKDIGVGAFARLFTPKSKTEFLYSSATNNIVANLKYDITNSLRIRMAKNDYLDGGWMGGTMPDYGAQLDYVKDTRVPQANVFVRNFLSAGIYKGLNEKQTKKLTTGRYKWQMIVRNQAPLISWEKFLMLGYEYQHDLSLYNTGDRMGVVRFGPRLYSDLGRLFLETTYFVAGKYGSSPFDFDRYRYGKDAIRFRGQFYINKYMSVGYYANCNINGRDYDGKRLTENQLVASVGTEDMKLRFGYDTVRKSSVIGLDMLLGANKTHFEFDEMKVSNVDPKNKKERKEKKKSKL